MLNMYKQAFERLVFWLDDAFEIPFFKKRVGLDPIIGLIPGFGELLTVMLSMVPVLFAWKDGAPLRIVLRMIFNALIDTGIGLIPIFGDAFDFMFKSNRRNYNIYLYWQKNPGKVTRNTTWGFALVLLFITLLMFGTLVSAFWMIKYLYQFI